MHLLFKATLFLILSASVVTGTVSTRVIENYEPVLYRVSPQEGDFRLAIRKFVMDGQAMLLVVDAETLACSLLSADTIVLPAPSLHPSLENSRYFLALNKYTSAPHQLHNGGARHAGGRAGGLFLTIDMCPSSRKYEREIFAKVRQLPQEKPVPLSLAITRLWMERHQDELEEILAFEKAGEVKITWINHSATHPYHPQEPLERNFLLSPGTDFKKEVLDTEQALLRRGLLPSPFFRFPGLVADGKLMEQLKELGLIPVGSDAWLAKGERPAEGSIILIHGNGNEPSGVKLLLDLFKEPRQLKLLPLQTAFQ